MPLESEVAWGLKFGEKEIRRGQLSTEQLLKSAEHGAKPLEKVEHETALRRLEGIDMSRSRPLFTLGLSRRLINRGGWRKFVPVSGGDGTKKYPPGNIFDQNPGEMSLIRSKLVNQIGIM